MTARVFKKIAFLLMPQCLLSFCAKCSWLLKEIQVKSFKEI